MKQMTMKQTREALAFLSLVDMMHVEGLAAGTINENAARIEYKAQGGRPVRYIRISSRARKANLDAIAAAVAEAIGAERWAEIVAVVTGEQIEETEETEETTAPAEEQTTETETETEEMKEDTTVEKIKVVYEKKEGRTYTETWRSEKPEEVYERLAHCLIAKKLNNCGWIRSIKRVPLYNGFDRITITHDNGGRDVYTVASH